MLKDTVRARLDEELIIWMTTVRNDGQPQTSPVWFLLEDDGILVYSKDGTIRNSNVLHNPRVALNLDGDGRGGAVVSIEGKARIDDATPPAYQHQSYLDKYADAIAANGWTPAKFSEDYPVPIRVTIDRVRAW